MRAPDGTLTVEGGRDVIRFDRRFPHSTERVWRALTEPDEIVQWLAEAELDLTEGGNVMLRWLNVETEGDNVARGTISALDPPHLLELDTDVHGILRWELQDDGDGCVVRLTVSLPSPFEGRIENMAGWHIHLDHLAEALDGEPQDWSRWTDEQLPRWRQHHERYQGRYSTG
jgi:uncharacterized protein YndB with AHSA1/START domain